MKLPVPRAFAWPLRIICGPPANARKQEVQR
jgi:hypothetical protein